MNIVITINTDNAAFRGNAERVEVARILDGLSVGIRQVGVESTDGLVLRDLNGTFAGTVEVNP